MKRGTQIAIRLAALAAVNAGVYVSYVKAIENAKRSGMHGTLHNNGNIQYDDIVKRSYQSYVKSPNAAHADPISKTKV